jgi:hypothetical protein
MSLDRILEKVRQWRRPWASGSEPLEIHRAILEDVEAQSVAAGGGGRRVFPFDRVEVKLLAATPEEKVRLEAVSQEAWNLPAEVVERLRARGVRVPAGLLVTVVVVETPATATAGRRYALTFAKAAARQGADPAAAAAAAADAAPPETGPAAEGRPVLRLTVFKGKAVREAYAFDADRIYVGRLEEVLDDAGRVRRRNDIAFLEEGDLNQTVSREHARIAWEPESRAFWLRDEGSSAGTVIFRAGRSIEVSRHDRRGVRLESGDEVYLGRAAVRVEAGGSGAEPAPPRDSTAPSGGRD